ncbi:MAG: hypothetical protein ACRDSI_20290 [Pseudonocardiaceae bacterium]
METPEAPSGALKPHPSRGHGCKKKSSLSLLLC